MRTNESMTASQVLAALETDTREAVAAPSRSRTRQIADVLELVEAAQSHGIARSELVAILNRAGMAIDLSGFETTLKRLRQRRRARGEQKSSLDRLASGPERSQALSKRAGSGWASTALPSAAELPAEDPKLSPADARLKAAEAAFRESSAGTSLIERFKRD